MSDYYTDQHGTLRRTVPKVRQSKKERIKQRWEGRIRFDYDKKGGRGNTDDEAIEKVKQYLRNHPDGVRAVDLASHIGTSQARAARLLDLLSGNSDDNSFLVYTDEEKQPPLYYVFKDCKNEA